MICSKGYSQLDLIKKKSMKIAAQMYDQKTLSLDSRIDLELSFGGKSMKTLVYMKNDAHDQLLLSEGVCRQLGIITYHPLHVAERWRGTTLPSQKPMQIQMSKYLELWLA